MHDFIDWLSWIIAGAALGYHGGKIINRIIRNRLARDKEVSKAEPMHADWARWQGDGSPPPNWWAIRPDGTKCKVYRSYEDYCDD